MYNIASFVFSILTISFVVISLRLLFRNGRLPAKLIYFDEKGKGVLKKPVFCTLNAFAFGLIIIIKINSALILLAH